MKDAMLKGSNRRLVVVRSRDSKLFEEAHFILREENADQPLADLLEEANRIVEKSHFPTHARTFRRSRLSFSAGILVGASIEAVGLAIYLLLA